MFSAHEHVHRTSMCVQCAHTISLCLCCAANGMENHIGEMVFYFFYIQWENIERLCECKRDGILDVRATETAICDHVE